jgi:hypothetical protein
LSDAPAGRFARVLRECVLPHAMQPAMLDPFLAAFYAPEVQVSLSFSPLTTWLCSEF